MSFGMVRVRDHDNLSCCCELSWLFIDSLFKLCLSLQTADMSLDDSEKECAIVGVQSCCNPQEMIERFSKRMQLGGSFAAQGLGASA